MRKIFIIVLFLALGCFHLGAQNDYRKTYEDFSRAVQQSYGSFTDTVNIAFAKAIGTEWAKYNLSEGNSRQVDPEPDTLPIAEETQTVFHVVAVSAAIDTLPGQWPLETDSALWTPKEPADRNNSKVVKFLFYGSQQAVSVPKEYGVFHPKGISETDVAEFWVQLSKSDYKLILADCAKNVELYGYNDWAVLEWVQALSSQVFPRNIYSEQTIFAVFLLNQMGLMVKIARSDTQLISLFSSMQPVYARKFVIIDTYPFYLAEKSLSATEVFTYRADFMKPAHPLDLRIQKPISLGVARSFKTYHKRSAFLNSSFDLPVNGELIRFYSSYPQTTISVYATAQPEKRFSTALLAGIGNSLKRVDEEEKVNDLLAFVHTDFQYKTDLEQFGHEKPFFCEENFVNPYNDCEDRAALFAFLVKGLTSCKVVLLEYPDHVSTAVRLPKEIKGDHIKINGDNYYVCDPSFIGATAGMSMTKYKNVAVKVYAL